MDEFDDEFGPTDPPVEPEQNKEPVEVDEADAEKEEKANESRKDLIEIGGFLGIALVTYVLYTTIITSAEDVLARTTIPTSATIICLNLPYFVLTLFVPYYIDKVPLMTKALASLGLFALAILLIALIKTPGLRLIGVVVASLGMATAEIGFLSATSLHQDLAIYSFTSGTGLGAILGPAFYTAMTTFFCMHPSSAQLMLLLILPLYPVIAWFVNHYTHQPTPSARGNNVEYSRIGEDPTNQEDRHATLTWSEKVQASKCNMHLAVPLLIGLFADYATMQAVVTTIAFPNSPFDPRDHYQYYTLGFWIGELLGRSYGLVLSWGKPDWEVVTDKTWILSAIISGNLFFLILCSVYRFLPSYVIVVLLCFVTGASEGALYLNTFAVAGKNMRPRYKEFSRAFLTTALQGGVVLAGFTGLWLEPALQEHCNHMIKETEYCFTRSMHGWNASVSCIN
ncbi:protein BTN1 [Nematostella vectensis]|nr:protein BTN1 [Nematostella vectensis]